MILVLLVLPPSARAGSLAGAGRWELSGTTTRSLMVVVLRSTRVVVLVGGVVTITGGLLITAGGLFTTTGGSAGALLTITLSVGGGEVNKTSLGRVERYATVAPTMRKRQTAPIMRAFLLWLRASGS